MSIIALEQCRSQQLKKLENNPMTIALIILAYVANVFLNRWLNYLLWIKTGRKPDLFIWFLPLIATPTLLYDLISRGKFFDWFTGKHW